MAYSGPMIALSIVNMLLIAYLPNFYAAEIGVTKIMSTIEKRRRLQLKRDLRRQGPRL